MDFQQAVNYILGFTDYEKIPGILYTAANYDLRRMEALLKSLGNPHLRARTVHIAGTKGKGSTAAMVAAALLAAGYRVGLYTSPHLHTVRERIRVSGEMISEHDFAALACQLKPLVEALNERSSYGQLTTFEILTALAFKYFETKQVDFQVVEVGLGGRLDASNVVQPDVCIITSISLDHTEVLGNNVAAIAGEKAGIVKPGCTLVSAPQVQEAAVVLEERSRKEGVRLIQVGRDVTWRRIESNLCEQILEVEGERGLYRLTIPLLGEHQLENAATAVAALEVLSQNATAISKEAIQAGLAAVKWEARLQILDNRPLVVVDGAHNTNSMKRLVQALRQDFKYRYCFLVFGTSCDKDLDGMVRELACLSCRITLTRSSHPRAASIEILEQAFTAQGIETESAASVSESLPRLMNKAGPEDLICITGSLFVAAEAIDWYKSAKANI